MQPKSRNGVKRKKFCSLFPVSFSLGFTLAEVLITLGIIGIVAQMTIPTLMNSVQEQVFRTSLKKTFSVVSSAYTQAIQENGPPNTWKLVASQSPVGAKAILDALSPSLRITKNCGNDPGCFPSGLYKMLTGAQTGDDFDGNPEYAKAILADGSIIATFSFGTCLNAIPGFDKSICGQLYVDANGVKKPNKWGEDMFVFYFLEQGPILPRGTLPEGNFDTQCRDKKTHNVWSCAAWVIYNENMDYLKDCGSTLSWDGPTKCQ